jgi:hypothetical protein
MIAGERQRDDQHAKWVTNVNRNADGRRAGPRTWAG